MATEAVCDIRRAPENLGCMALTEPKYSALMRLYLEKRSDLIRFFTVRTGSAAEAEDIVQDMGVKLSGIDDRAIENPAGFLYRLGSNVMLDRVRSGRRSRARDDAFYQSQVLRRAGGSEDEAALPSPEQSVESRQRLARLLHIIDRMPEQRRKVFIHHKLEGLSYSDVATRLGISRSAVEKHMISALRQIAELRE